MRTEGQERVHAVEKARLLGVVHQHVEHVRVRRAKHVVEQELREPDVGVGGQKRALAVGAQLRMSWEEERERENASDEEMDASTSRCTGRTRCNQAHKPGRGARYLSGLLRMVGKNSPMRSATDTDGVSGIVHTTSAQPCHGRTFKRRRVKLVVERLEQVRHKVQRLRLAGRGRESVMSVAGSYEHNRQAKKARKRERERAKDGDTRTSLVQ